MTHSPDLSAFRQHVAKCNTATFRSKRTALYMQTSNHVMGWADKRVTDYMLTHSFSEKSCLLFEKDKIIISNPENLFELGEKLALENIYTSHNEPFDIFPDVKTPSVGRIDRGALPLFGFIGKGVHMNGLVKKGEDVFLWVGKRSSTKRLDPGKLDHIVAGGISAGYTAHETLLKEAQEEASIPTQITENAVFSSTVSYTLERPEGLRRDILYIYDLLLPLDFIPKPNDEEVEFFQLMPLKEVMNIVITTDQFKFNVNLVLIDLFFRYGLIDPSHPEAYALYKSLNRLF